MLIIINHAEDTRFTAYHCDECGKVVKIRTRADEPVKQTKRCSDCMADGNMVRALRLK